MRGGTGGERNASTPWLGTCDVSEAGWRRTGRGEEGRTPDASLWLCCHPTNRLLVEESQERCGQESNPGARYRMASWKEFRSVSRASARRCVADTMSNVGVPLFPRHLFPWEIPPSASLASHLNGVLPDQPMVPGPRQSSSISFLLSSMGQPCTTRSHQA